MRFFRLVLQFVKHGHHVFFLILSQWLLWCGFLDVYVLLSFFLLFIVATSGVTLCKTRFCISHMVLFVHVFCLQQPSVYLLTFQLLSVLSFSLGLGMLHGPNWADC